MYLSQLMVNPQWRAARYDLADRYELHRTLLRAFPETLDAAERVLYRVEDHPKQRQVVVLVQSHERPDWERADRLKWGYLLGEPRVREAHPAVTAGMQLMFRLHANPTVKQDGKRHAIYNEEALLTWLERKGAAHGFAFDRLGVQVVKLGKKHGQKGRQTWHAVQFDGMLHVVDGEALSAALLNGIGSAKAFGFGLLSIPYRAI